MAATSSWESQLDVKSRTLTSRAVEFSGGSCTICAWTSVHPNVPPSHLTAQNGRVESASADLIDPDGKGAEPGEQNGVL